MSGAPGTLDLHYRGLVGDDRTSENSDYSDLVTPDVGEPGAFHRWFKMKEAFSPRFLPRVVKDVGLDSDASCLRILDPFAGSGTIAVAAADLGPNCYSVGIECNPFLHLLASSKQRSIQERPKRLLDVANEALRAAERRLRAGERFSRPKLTTFQNRQYFEQTQLRRLLSIAAVLDDMHREDPSLEVDLLRVAAAATVEPISRLRRDGRALRYWSTKTRASTFPEFERRVAEINADIEDSRLSVGGRQVRGDSRRLDALLPEENPFDLAAFSPPYPNNIDYTEVYKLENWLLGFLTSRDEFRAQRLRTLHSHPSLRRSVAESDLKSLSEVISPVTDSVANSRYRDALTEMLGGYVVDMALTFRALGGLVRPGGRLVFAVGNSAHGSETDGIVVAADVILTATAELCGFESGRIEVARMLRRKRHSSPYLRESVCVLTRSSTDA